MRAARPSSSTSSPSARSSARRRRAGRRDGPPIQPRATASASALRRAPAPGLPASTSSWHRGRCRRLAGRSHRRGHRLGRARGRRSAGGRPRGRRRDDRRRSRPRRSVDAAEQRAAPVAEEGEADRAEHEEGAENRGRLGQDRRALAGAEGRLAAAATERARHVPTLALLQQDDDQEQEADQDVDGGDEVVEHNDLVYRGPPPVRPGRLVPRRGNHFRAAWKLVTILAKPCGSRLAPPTRAPSMSRSAARAATLSGLTLPP